MDLLQSVVTSFVEPCQHQLAGNRLIGAVSVSLPWLVLIQLIKKLFVSQQCQSARISTRNTDDNLT